MSRTLAASRKYAAAHREERRLACAAWRSANPDKHISYSQKYESDHREERRLAKVTRRAVELLADPEKARRQQREANARAYARRTPEQKAARRIHRRNYEAARLKTSPEFYITKILRGRLRGALRNRGVKSACTLELTGCTAKHCKSHIEAQFLTGMTWNNRGLWHVDHIKPCASFDLADPAQQRACFHYSNLRPLWALDNLKKGRKIVA